MRIKNKVQPGRRGFTLVELLIYVALVSVFVTGAIMFTWDVIYGRERSHQKQVVDLNIRSAMARISYELRGAKTVDNITPTSIDLENNDGSITTIALNSGKIEISPSGTGPYALTSNQVTVSNLAFNDFSSSDQNSKNVKFQLTVEPNFLLPGQSSVSSNASQSIEFNSQFNLARQVLIDLSGATFTGSNRLTNAKIRNTGTSDILIDQLIISWTNSTPVQNVTEVQIAGGDIEWVGSASSGNFIDITDFLLVGQSSQTPINHIQFDSDISSELIFVTFVLIDGSSTTGVIDLSGVESGGGSCQSFCESLSYSAGTCRRRPSLCTSNSETHESGGDQFCTVNPNDTCCCLP